MHFYQNTGARREGWTAEKDPVGQSRRSTARGTHFNLKETSSCRFAADLVAVGGRPNFLLRLLAARGAGSVGSSDGASRLA
jgi:hypothetical protein